MNDKALAAYFERVCSEPAKLGGLDCVRFVIEAIREGWDHDFTAILGYDSRRTACERLRIAGGLENAFTAELGTPINPADLRAGDIAYFIDPAVGLVMPGYIAVKMRGTIARVPLQFAAKGWSWVRS